jgi:polar amino acid transport system permease protein
MSISLDFTPVIERWPMLVSGAWLTLKLSTLATVTGFVTGTFCAIAARGKQPILRYASNFYIEMIRNTPLLVQLFLFYFGFSSVGFSLPVFVVVLIALTFNVGAYTAEIMRAGFDSIPKGQLEAAECLGLPPPQIYWHVMLRPAMERVYPALTGQFVLMMLFSSLTSQVSAEDLTAAANYIQSETYRPFETYLVIAVVYLVLSLVMRFGFWLLGLALFRRRRLLGTPL